MTIKLSQCGIYKITNKLNGKFYIGATTTPFSLCFGQHKTMLRGSYHFNPHLQYSWNKYGETSFEFEAIEACDINDCATREQHYIDALKPEYNVIKKQRTQFLYKHNQTTKDRISLAFQGKNHPLYSGEYTFYHPSHGYFTGGLKELPQKFNFSETAGYKLKSKLLFKSNGWIYIGPKGTPRPNNIDEVYHTKLAQEKPTYTFYNPTFGPFHGTIPEFINKYKIRHSNGSTIHSLVSGERKMAWGWICAGVTTPEVSALQSKYSEAIKLNTRLRCKNNIIYTFMHPTHGRYTMPLNQFIKKFNVHPGCIKRVCSNTRKSYLGWTILQP